MTVVRSINRPLNVIAGLQGVQLSVVELSEIGVKRIGVGSALSRAAWGAFLKGAREMLEHGTFDFAEDAAKYADLNAIFSQASRGGRHETAHVFHRYDRVGSSTT